LTLRISLQVVVWRLLALLALAVHWLGLGWAALGLLDGETWVDAFEFRSEVPLLGDPLSLYLRSVYWSSVSMSTVGYGDVVASTQPEMGYTMFVMLLGHALYTYFFAAITTLIANTEHISAGFRTLVEQTMRCARAARSSPRLASHRTDAMPPRVAWVHPALSSQVHGVPRNPRGAQAARARLLCAQVAADARLPGALAHRRAAAVDRARRAPRREGRTRAPPVPRAQRGREAASLRISLSRRRCASSCTRG
jgi:hypothetical protein